MYATVVRGIHFHQGFEWHTYLELYRAIYTSICSQYNGTTSVHAVVLITTQTKSKIQLHEILHLIFKLLCNNLSCFMQLKTWCNHIVDPQQHFQINCRVPHYYRQTSLLQSIRTGGLQFDLRIVHDPTHVERPEQVRYIYRDRYLWNTIIWSCNTLTPRSSYKLINQQVKSTTINVPYNVLPIVLSSMFILALRAAQYPKLHWNACHCPGS